MRIVFIPPFYCVQKKTKFLWIFKTWITVYRHGVLEACEDYYKNMKDDSH